jgi:hypothetical protein
VLVPRILGTIMYNCTECYCMSVDAQYSCSLPLGMCGAVSFVWSVLQTLGTKYSTLSI